MIRRNNTGKDNEYDVIVVGAGMTGMAMAQALEMEGLSVCLVECHALDKKIKTPETRYDIRVSALTEASWLFLKRLGLWKKTDVSRICPYEQMQVWDARGTGRIHFHASEVGYSRLGHIVENQLVSSGLLALLKGGSARLVDRVAVREVNRCPESVSVHLENGETLACRVLVASDGAESWIRRHLAIPVAYSDCLHQAMVCNIRTKDSHRHCAWQVFADSGPLAFLPLPGTCDDQGRDLHHASVVWSLRPDEARKMKALDDDDFCRMLTRRSEFCSGEVCHVSERHCVPLAQRHASTYVKGRVVLVGDAAHTVHPLAGQGANLGLMDVAVLAEEIIRAFHSGSDIGSALLLEKYVKRRRWHNRVMLNAMSGFQHLFDSRALSLNWLRNTGMSVMNGYAGIKRQIIRQAMGVKGDVPAMMQAEN